MMQLDKTYPQTPASFCRTPASFGHTRNANYQIESTSEDPLIRPEHQDVTNKVWKTNKLSPLWDFKPSRLVRYVEELKSFIIQNGHVSQVSAEMKLLRGFQRSADDARAINITVTYTLKKNTRIVNGILCNASSNPGTLESNFTNYPLLILDDLEVVSELIKSWIKKTFDCTIYPLILSGADLKWLFTLLIHTMSTEDDNALSLKYMTRKGLSFTITLCSGLTSKHLRSVLDGDEDTISSDTVYEFTSSLELNAYNHFHIDFNKLTLHKVSTPVAEFSSQGEIKIYEEDKVILILMYLAELALLQLNN